MDRRESFLQDLKEVLKTHDVEIVVDDYNDLQMEAEFGWRQDDFTEDINFGSYVDVSKIEYLIEKLF